MDLKQLKRFLAVVDQGSFSAAARYLNVSQQALSTSITGLENEINLQLFERSPGGITRATAYGRALVRHARSQFASLERAKQELRAIHDASTGTITIGVGEVASDIVALAITRLHNLRPEIRINVIEGYSEQLIERLREGEFDFVVAGTGGLLMSEQVSQELLYSANDILVVRTEHPLAGKSNLTLYDLQEFTWMVPYTRSSDLDAIVDAFTAEKLEPPRSIMGTDSYTIGSRLLLSNDFIFMTSPALVSDEFSGQDIRFAKLNISTPSVRRHAHILLSSDHHLSPAATMLYNEIKDICFEKDL